MSRENVPYYILNSLFSYHWTKITPKNENWGHSCPQGSKRAFPIYKSLNLINIFLRRTRYLQNSCTDLQDVFAIYPVFTLSCNAQKRRVSKKTHDELVFHFRTFIGDKKEGYLKIKWKYITLVRIVNLQASIL